MGRAQDQKAAARDLTCQCILYFADEGKAPERDVERMRIDAGINVVSAHDDIFLVHADQASIDRFISEAQGWKVSTGAAIEFPVENSLTRAKRAQEASPY